jgi:hypothetical protein
VFRTGPGGTAAPRSRLPVRTGMCACVPLLVACCVQAPDTGVTTCCNGCVRVHAYITLTDARPGVPWRAGFASQVWPRVRAASAAALGWVSRKPGSGISAGIHTTPSMQKRRASNAQRDHAEGGPAAKREAHSWVMARCVAARTAQAGMRGQHKSITNTDSGVLRRLVAPHPAGCDEVQWPGKCCLGPQAACYASSHM